ncbi:unnamed protein product [Thlaspi arvense]|uniref:DUF3752 domain-containing protein n=1 Tax=Thlaspi arvense TaxID=13288 RepID=A0AAU9SUL4_THLAR|nr:unnamed protein product [Thlaspi arvense]
MGKHRKREDTDSDDETPSSASSSSCSSYSSDDSDSSSSKRRKRRKSDGGYEREKRKKREREKRKKMERRKRKEKKMKDRKKKKRDYESDSMSDQEDEPETVVKEMLIEFPNVGNDLKQLLRMIDDGQAVDIKGISEKALKTRLKKLFLSLKLKERGDRVFLLPPGASPSLDIVGHLIKGSEEEDEGAEKNLDDSKKTEADATGNGIDETKKTLGDENGIGSNAADDVAGPKKRVIGPAMPSAELLAAAAKLTEAQAELREAELEEDSEYFIGPAPPAVVAEVASSNEAERFEEVTRIMEAEANSPYDVLGVNHNMAADNMKKRKAMDDKIKLKEEQEAFKAELRSMQEAAQWRRSQGISMEGDEELLAATEVKPVPKRDEWMTTLPPERKAGVVVQQSTTTFSRNAREGRGDTTVWTDTPMDKAERAKMNYLEAYNKANALASNEGENMKRSLDADLVDKYNKEKRSKSLVEKHREGSSSLSSSRLKKKKKLSSSSSSKDKADEKDEWVGKHPWKPWDRENDLTAGRQSVKLDAEGMAEGLASKFSSGNFQRSFL